MKNKIFIFITLVSICFAIPFAGASWFSKKPQTTVFLSSKNPDEHLSFDTELKSEDFFKTNSRIYFQVFCPEGFKSDYIKYQIVKQDDNAHTGGYSRIRNITARVKNKNYYSDYFVLTEAGKYFIQIFNIENLQQWLVMANFRVAGD